MRLQRLKDLRDDSDLRQKEIAEFLHIGTRSYSHYEFGTRQIPLELLIRLADYYHTSLDYLVGRTNEKTPYPDIKKSSKE